jgi:peptide/nickel transport system substrate-binding protein
MKNIFHMLQARPALYSALAVFSVFVIIVCFSIFNGTAATESQTSQVPTKPQQGGIVVVGIQQDFDSFNELNASDADALQVINEMLFMTLTRLDENFKHVPYLASSWEFSQQGKVITFKIRDDVTWSDGHPTTAYDVLFTYQLATNPDVAYPAADRFDMTENVKVLDEFTIQFTLTKPYPDVLFDTKIPILPKHILETIPSTEINKCAFNRRPVGNGPFILKEWKANHHVVFDANECFALGRPLLDRIIFSVQPDENVMLMNLQTNAVDVLPYISTHNFKSLHSNKKYKTARYNSKAYSFMAWNCTRLHLTPKARRALSYAIHKDEIIATLLDGYAKPVTGPILPFQSAFDETLTDLEYNPEQALALLKEEGWIDTNEDGYLDNGLDRFSITIKTNAGTQLRKDVAVMVQAQLKRIGVKVKIEILEFNLLLEQVFDKGDFDVLLAAWDVDFTVNPTPLFHSASIKDGYNFIGYSNPQVDELLEKARTMSDAQLAVPVWKEFQKAILFDCPYTFLFSKDNLATFQPNIHGIKMDERGFLSNVAQWWVSTNS